jgi:FkbM family methyltransferase
MRTVIKQLVKSSINFAVKMAVKTLVGRYFLAQISSGVMSRTRSVLHQGVDLTFVVPNAISHFRIDTFSTKEPETLEWIDEIPQGSVLWDIGANIGLYTCYAVEARGCRVFAFEPSVFNLELLARNIFLNGLVDQVTIIPIPLSDNRAFNTFNMESTEWAGACSTFGQSYGQDGQALDKTFEFQTIGVSMADAVEFLGLPQPDYIKMDVDGIEHLILKGGASVLRNVDGVLIEINEEFEKQSVNSARYLSEAGLVLKEKRQADMFKNGPYKNSYNQIWHRSLTK